MIRGPWLVAALAALALFACGPPESDASNDRPHKPGEPRVTIRPAKPRPPTSPTQPSKPDPKPVPKTAPKPTPTPAPKPGPKPASKADPKPAPPPDDGIPRAAVNFGAGRAGILKAEQLDRDLQTYPYESAGTFASVGLSKRLPG